MGEVLETGGKVLLEHKGYIPFTVSCSTFYSLIFRFVYGLPAFVFLCSNYEVYKTLKNKRAHKLVIFDVFLSTAVKKKKTKSYVLI